MLQMSSIVYNNILMQNTNKHLISNFNQSLNPFPSSLWREHPTFSIMEILNGLLQCVCSRATSVHNICSFKSPKPNIIAHNLILQPITAHSHYHRLRAFSVMYCFRSAVQSEDAFNMTGQRLRESDCICTTVGTLNKIWLVSMGRVN